MNFNILLVRLGFEPDNFINKQADPIKTDDGFIYEVEQEVTDRKCPHCNSSSTHIHSYSFVEYKCTNNNNVIEILRIKKPRLLCLNCKRTFTKQIIGIERYSCISNQVKLCITNDFTKPLTFKQISDNYGINSSTVIKLFDEKVKYVPRLRMPRVLCIDEIRFSKELDQKFICVITDFDKSEIVDLIQNRQLPYLREYFGSIPLKERENTKVFISDMYDAYSTVCHSYFPKAIHVVDLFHVVTQLTNAVNRIRTKVMNTEVVKKSKEYNFMKAHWKYFLCRKSKIPNKFYTYAKDETITHYSDLVFDCLKINMSLWTSYDCLQELFKYSSTYTYEEALKFIERICFKLNATGEEILKSVAKTYHKWRYEIANGFTKKQADVRYTNAKAEALNNQLKTIIKNAYGYHNFERFRKRALLIKTYNK